MPMDQEDRDGLHPTLTAKRERPFPGKAIRTFMFPLRATPQMSPRARAVHFSKLESGRTVRPTQGSAGGQRRVLVKARVVRMTPGAAKALMTHVRYVERDGVGPTGEDGRFFDRDTDLADGRAFASRCADDRHHFRIIVNPEDGQELPDLKAYARTFMERVERDMGTSMDWIAGEHHDTGRPHLHLLLRGKRDDGRDLVLPRDYVSHGMRGRAQELATEILGPRLEQIRSPELDAAANRFTLMDRTLIAASREGGLAMADLTGLDEPLALRRLTYLETQGFIRRERAGRWRIPDDLRQTLEVAGEREAREAAAGKAVWGTRMEGRSGAVEAVSVTPGEPLVGAYVGRAPIGTQSTGPQVVVVDLLDGRLGHVRLPSRDSLLALDRVPEGAIVRVLASPPSPRPSDLTIAEIASERGGIYSAADHKAVRPTDRDSFIERHVRRLEAMGREGACEAIEQGRFRIPDDYAQTALKIDQSRQNGVAIQLKVLDDRSLSSQVSAPGRTWLDTTLTGRPSSEIGTKGFGAEVTSAQAQRAGHLKTLGIGSGHPLTLTPEQMSLLRTKEVQVLFDGLGYPNRSVSLAKEGQKFSGVYLSRVHASGNAWAVVEGRAGIVLAPWRAALEACRGQAITCVLQGGSVDFTFGLQSGRSPGLGAGRGQGLEL
ncbi:DUF3363 domain-containing protein [Brevundimonas sp.]